jgi:hypothetical protein
MSELALKLIEKAKQEKAEALDIGRCGLIELPEELFELEDLISGDGAAVRLSGSIGTYWYDNCPILLIKHRILAFFSHLTVTNSALLITSTHHT